VPAGYSRSAILKGLVELAVVLVVAMLVRGCSQARET